jgi:hypothetical protein
MAFLRGTSTGGGCLFWCLSSFNEVPLGLSLSLSFSYDEETGQITSANIRAEIDTSATFIGPNPRAQRAAVTPHPAFRPNPEISSVRINSSVLKKLTAAQLRALDKATYGKRDPVSQAVQRALLAEEQRRAEEQRKKQEEERKERCKQDKNACGS